jgi:hypothetical protein
MKNFYGKFRENNLIGETIMKNHLMKKRRSPASWILSSFFRRLIRKYSKLLLFFTSKTARFEEKNIIPKNDLFCLGSKKSEKMECKKEFRKSRKSAYKSINE